MSSSVSIKIGLSKQASEAGAINYTKCGDSCCGCCLPACHVTHQGCDGSVLLDGPRSEKTAAINAALHGFEVIDVAKAAVEKACPGVVSCADILAFASRDSVKLTGGQGWAVPAGRKDGLVSNAAEPAQELPLPSMKVDQLLPMFAKKGITAQQMVALAG